MSELSDGSVRFAPLPTTATTTTTTTNTQSQTLLTPYRPLPCPLLRYQVATHGIHGDTNIADIKTGLAIKTKHDLKARQVYNSTQ